MTDPDTAPLPADPERAAVEWRDHDLTLAGRDPVNRYSHPPLDLERERALRAVVLKVAPEHGRFWGHPRREMDAAAFAAWLERMTLELDKTCLRLQEHDVEFARSRWEGVALRAHAFMLRQVHEARFFLVSAAQDGRVLLVDYFFFFCARSQETRLCTRTTLPDDSETDSTSR